MSIILYFARAYPRRSLVTVACLLVAGVMEGFGLITFLPLLALVVDTTDTRAPTASSTAAFDWVRTALESVGLPFSLPTVALALLVAIWIKAAVMLASKRQVGNSVAHVAADLRHQLLKSLMNARWGYIARSRTGRLANAIATEAGRAAAAYYHLAMAAQHVILTALGIGFALWISWRLALAAVGGGLAIAIVLGIFVRLAARAGGTQTVATNSLLSRLTDALSNAKLLKATGRSRLVTPLLSADTERIRRALRKQVLAEESLKSMQEPLVLLVLVLALVYGRLEMGLAFEQASVLIFALERGLIGATKVQRNYQMTVMNGSALWSLRELNESAIREVEVLEGHRAPSLENAIELKGVSLDYQEQSVLRDADLEIPAFEITALTGESGGGKTTIIDLITGLVHPTEGRVSVDGCSLAEIDMRLWRSQIGYVPQEVILFNDTVGTNVGLGDPRVSHEQIVAALEAASAWGFVSRMNGGLDAAVGERGNLLSGGQRARIGLARALAHQPRLLVLDEVTAALDPRAEAEVWGALTQLRGRLTILAVSHQPALFAAADRVYRVHGGSAHRIDHERMGCPEDAADRDRAGSARTRPSMV